MDIDAFVARNQGDWQRLDALARAARKPRTMPAGDLDELVHLYQRVGGQLAQARVAYAGDQRLVTRLTMLVNDAHTALYSERTTDPVRAVRVLFTDTFPQAIRHIRWFILAAAGLTFVPWAVFQIWLAVSPRAFDVSAPAAVREAYINTEFEDYYSSKPAAQFATEVFTNNVRVAVLAFALGIFACVLTAIVLAYNGANVGMAGGLFTHEGQWERFWGLILPHGLLELSAVVVAGAAGLRMGWCLIDPGDRRRFDALAAEGRRMAAVLLGLVVAFLLAAMVEAFVTGRPWPTSARVLIGVAVFGAFWGYVVAFAARRPDPATADLSI
jgi:uncharacterized membrane protein SpoIIM required for sporulation